MSPQVRDPVPQCFLGSLWNNAWLADRRGRELARIRQIFIPELILRLHGLLISSRTHIPEYVLRFPSHPHGQQ